MAVMNLFYFYVTIIVPKNDSLGRQLIDMKPIKKLWKLTKLTTAEEIATTVSSN